MPYIGNIPAEKYASYDVQHITTSATSSYVLDKNVANENEIRVVLNNIVQQPGSSYAYTASGNTLTLSAATTSSDTLYVVFTGKAVQTVTPPPSSVGLSQLNATGSPGTNTFLRGDNSWATPSDIDTDTVRPNAMPLVINGSMAVAQRATSATGLTSSGYNTVDRFKTNISGLGTWTETQESLTSGNAYTDGFSNALKIDCTTADASPAASDRLYWTYRFEGQDLQLLKKGTANAEKVTVSFWIKATKTGTNILELYDNDNVRDVSAAYTISTTNTWEHKVVSFPADTTGVLDNNNASSLYIIWALGAGSNYTSGTLNTSWSNNVNANRYVGQVNHADSTSNNVHITGVQMEVGEYTSATIPSFQFEGLGESLLRCQRYFRSYGGGDAYEQVSVGYTTGAQGSTFIDFSSPVMRATPTMSLGTIGNWKIYSNGAGYTCSGNPGASDPTPRNMKLLTDHASGATAGQGAMLQANGTTNARLTLDAEL